jgi:hypothetical protein
VLPLDDATAKFKSWFLDERNVRFPIAFYKQASTPTDYGDATAEDNPNYAHYLFLGKPTVYLTDSTGVIRRVFVGYSREMEQDILDAVRHLMPSAISTTSSAAGPATLPQKSFTLSFQRHP